MKISYAFTCGRLETIFKISNHLKYGNKNNIENEQLVIDKFRADILSNMLKIEDTELFSYLKNSDETIILNRTTRALKENSGLNTDPRIANEYKNGVWHELKEYKLSDRLVKAKKVLEVKYLERTGMNITSRDIGEMTGINSNTLRNMLAHKRDVVIGMLEKFEKFVDSY
ncbi:hypothetical protein ACRJAL_003541 [Acinetobacter baumannii]|uniref:hypothetical protein n=1 Tax=Acinetobacter TaxID=469 RepID=UPI00259E6926|nr:hypothetical protein [Acinetobacter variabilis]EKV2617696.1 hypothetical protein [Acinetobacter baumannii]